MKKTKENKMEEYVLVKFEDNWADEMDIEGFRVIPRQSWEAECKLFKEHKEPFTYCIGTNEEIEYTSGEDALRRFNVLSITEDERRVLRLLGISSSGFVGPDATSLGEEY